MTLLDSPNLLTIAEVADCLGVSTASIRRYVASGRLKHVRVGHLVRLRESDIMSFIEPNVADKRRAGSRG